jgi:hypothetical protein
MVGPPDGVVRALGLMACDEAKSETKKIIRVTKTREKEIDFFIIIHLPCFEKMFLEIF